MATPRTNAAHDQNREPSLLGVSTVDGSTPVSVEVDPTTGSMLVTETNSTTIAKPVPSNLFRDGFGSMDNTKWNYGTTQAASDLVYVGGNAAAASWVSICKSALVADTYTELLSVNSYPLNIYSAVGISLSQRIAGQQFAFEFVGVDNSGSVINGSTVADIALSNVSASVTSNVVTFTASSVANLVVGDQVVIFGCSDSRMNVGVTPITSISISTNTFTVANTIANGSYTVGASAFVRVQPYDAYGSYHAGYHLSGTSATAADAISKNGERMPETSSVTTASTNATIPNEGGVNYSTIAYVYPQRPTAELNLRLHNKYAQYIPKPVDSTGSANASLHRSQNIPDSSRNYKIRFRARNLVNHNIPVGYVTAASKTGSTTATVTIPSHGLTTNDWIQIYGAKDQANYPNVTTSAQVASVVDANTITVVWGGAVTASTYGATVFRVQGQNTLPAITTSGVSTYAKTTDGLRLSLVFTATQGATIIPGEVWTLYGLVDSTNTAQTGLHGRYRVESSNTTTFTVELTPLDGQSLSGVSTTPANAGGALIRNTEFRLHYFRTETETPLTAEITSGFGDTDSSTAVTVNVNGSNANALVGGTTWSGLVAQSAAKLAGFIPGAPVSNADVASAARTATGNSGTVALDWGAAITGLINVTANSGTNQRMDIALQESPDNGTTFYDIWHAPRYGSGYLGNTTAQVPYMLMGGRRRWLWTINGTSPSFTFTITAMVNSLPPSGVLRNFFDYTSAANGTINVNTLNSTTGTWFVEGCKEYTLNISMGAVTTTAPIFQLQASPTGLSTDWFNIGATVTGTASTNQTLSISNTPARFVRVLVQTAGSGATCNFVNLVGR